MVIKIGTLGKEEPTSATPYEPYCIGRTDFVGFPKKERVIKMKNDLKDIEITQEMRDEFYKIVSIAYQVPIEMLKPPKEENIGFNKCLTKLANRIEKATEITRKELEKKVKELLKNEKRLKR